VRATHMARTDSRCTLCVKDGMSTRKRQLSAAASFVFVFISASPCDLVFFIEQPATWNIFCQPRCQSFATLALHASVPDKCAFLHKRKEHRHKNRT